MRRRAYFEAGALLLFAMLFGGVYVGATANAQVGPPHWPEEEPQNGAMARLLDVDGEVVGTVTFSQFGELVLVDARFNDLDLEPGFYGFHLHEVGQCDPRAAGGPFMTAGGHLAREGETHGEHAGDFPPLHVTPGGTGHTSFTTHRFSVGSITAGNATAVVIHRQRDNFGHIPDRYTAEGAEASGPDDDTLATGDAGDRYACGVVERVDEPGREAEP